MSTTTRLADPWTDLDVIDRNGPRTNQAFVGLGATLAVVLDQPWIVAVLALQLALGLTLGRKWCLPCRFWFQVLQPRFGEGPLEDSRAPRFANRIALGFTGGATLAFLAGMPSVAWALTGTVAAVALFSAISGFCIGCVIYARIWGCETCAVPQRG
ncbi:MAG TPA: DUF4395 domain-containing protein [Baekduia sp.]|nr:DUF4395 domain-containing protein [Baekduia sp.]